MTKDEAKHQSDILRAFSEGRSIEVKIDGKWADYREDYFFFVAQQYRIKPESNDEKFYFGMPEYNNKDLNKPVMTAMLKFRTLDDYQTFIKVLQPYYGDRRIFDGGQKKNSKTAWFPPLDKGSEYYYE